MSKVSLMNPVIREQVRDPHCDLCKMCAGTNSERDVCLTAEGEGKFMVVLKMPPTDRTRSEIRAYLSEAGLEPDDFVITSAIKCKSWDASPGKTEIKACKSYLEEEVKILKPKWIIVFGNEALQATVGLAQVTKYRGLVYDWMGAKVLVSISPSMVARKPGMRDGFLADLAYFKRLAFGGDVDDKLKPKSFTVVTNKDKLTALCKHLETCGGYSFDIETNGFDEYKPDSKIVSLGLTTWQHGDTAPRDIWVIPLFHPSSPFMDTWRTILRILGKYLKKPPVRVAHNGKFDLRWLNEFKCNIDLTFDTMLAAHLLDENRGKGLKPLARTILGVAPWDIETKDLLSEPLKPTLKYNGLDTWYTAHLYFHFKAQLEEQPSLMKLNDIMMVPASNAFTEIERHGIWVDRETLQTNAKIAKETLDEIDAKLFEYVPDKSEWPANIKAVNYNASNFARWWLFDYLGLPVLERGKEKMNGKHGDPSMAEGVMQKLQKHHHHPVVDLMLSRVKWQKFHSSFFTAYLEQIDERDRIHTTFKLTGTVTGRLSSGKGDDEKVTGRVQNRGVNLQQVPRDPFVKGIFGGPDGHVFLECDYSQVELRVAAFLAQETTMLNLYRNNQDIHMATAMQMTGKSASQVTSEERKKAKPVNFGFLYGMSANTFITTAWNNYGVEVTEQESIVFRKAFFTAYPLLHQWHARQRRLAAKYGRVQSPIGRVRHLPDIYSKNHQVKAEAERQAINSPVQSFASDMTVLAMVTLTQAFKRMGLKAKSVGTVHDAINFEVPIPELPVVMPMIKYHMENVPMKEWFGVEMNVPIVGDVAVARRWGNKEEVDGDIVTDEKRLQKWLKDHDLR